MPGFVVAANPRLQDVRSWNQQTRWTICPCGNGVKYEYYVHQSPRRSIHRTIAQLWRCSNACQAHRDSPAVESSTFPWIWERDFSGHRQVPIPIDARPANRYSSRATIHLEYRQTKNLRCKVPSYGLLPGIQPSSI